MLVRIFYSLPCVASALVVCAASALAQQPAPANITSIATQIDQAAQSANLDLAHMRIDKWKTDGNLKQEAQHNTESLQRNLSSALPELTGQTRTNPSDVATMFRLYRVVGAVYDVLSNVAENSGAFGPKAEYELLAQDVQRFDQLRHALGDAVEQAAARQSSDLAALRSAAVATQNAAASAPPKKVIIDDTEPAPKKKTTKKKKAAPQTSPQ